MYRIQTCDPEDVVVDVEGDVFPSLVALDEDSAQETEAGSSTSIFLEEQDLYLLVEDGLQDELLEFDIFKLPSGVLIAIALDNAEGDDSADDGSGDEDCISPQRLALLIQRGQFDLGVAG